MINELFGQVMYDFFIGVFIGVIDEWNKKITFFIIMSALVLCVIGISIYGVDSIYSGYPWWRNLFEIFFVVIGIECGNIIYKEFKK